MGDRTRVGPPGEGHPERAIVKCRLSAPNERAIVTCRLSAPNERAIVEHDRVFQKPTGRRPYPLR